MLGAAACGAAAAVLSLLVTGGIQLWLASGVALAVSVLWGPRHALALGAGTAMAFLFWVPVSASQLPFLSTLLASLLLGLGIGAGAWVGTLVIRRTLPGLDWMRGPHDVLWALLAFLCGGLPPALAEFLSHALGFAPPAFGGSWLQHSAGMLAVVPPVLLGTGWTRRSLPAPQRLEFLAVSAVLAGFGALLFGPLEHNWGSVHMESILLVPLFWAAVRLPAFHAALLALVAFLIVWCGTQAGYGIFAPPGAAAQIGESVVFAGVICLMVLLGAAISRTRHAALEETREAERRFRDLLENVQMAAIMLDYRGRVLFANSHLLELTGWTAGEVIGRDWFEMFVAFEPGAREIFMERLNQGPAGCHFEDELQTRDGQRLHLLWNTVVLRDPQGAVLGTASLGENITGRRAVAEQLRLQGAALAASANGVLISDTAGRIVWVNRAYGLMSGYEESELLGQTPRLLQSGQHDREFYRGIWTTVAAGRVWSGEIVNRRKNGTLYTVATTISPVRNAGGQITHYVAIQQDVTEKRELEQRVRQAQNMESVGRLAGGIAHAFNNLLQVILGSGEYLLQQLPPQERLRAEALEIERAAKQAAGLTNQLLAFSQQQVMTLRPLQLNLLLRGAETMLRRLVSENIRISYDLSEDLPWVLADQVQIEQLLLNLAAHTGETMPGGGQIWISTNAVVLTADRLPITVQVTPGRYVCLAVRDSGPGLDQKQRARLFEPFYSPTSPGHLSGLGLAVVDGIVRQHSGFVDIESPPGQGTTYRIYLPAHTATQPAPVPAAAPGPDGARRMVLLVEDDEAVRKLALRILDRAGYQVAAAASAAEARTLFQQHRDEVAALFTDVVLTDGSGLDLITEFARQRPDLPVLVASGYTDDKARWGEVQKQGYRYMQKPYTAAQVMAHMREILPPPTS